MPRLGTLVLACAITLALACGAWADTVHMTNGDRITGTVVKLDKGKLKVKTSYAGEISLDWSEVQRLETDQPVVVQTLGGRKLSGALAPATEGKVAVGGQSVDGLDRIAAINPEDLTKLKINGEINLGADIRDGNTDKKRLDADGRVVLRKTVHRGILGFESHREESKGKDTTDNDLGYLEYNRFISEDWYAFGNIRGERDAFKDLNLRLAAGGGMGYQAWQSEVTSLSLELGPNYIYEDTEDRGRREYTAARWNLDFDYWFFDHTVKLFHRQTLFVNVADTGEYFYTTRTGLSVPIPGGIAATLQYNYDYDNQPDPGKDTTDTRLILKLGYHW